MTCRICLETGELMSVCQCSGTCKYVHKECIDKWIGVSRKTHCELCLAPYTHIVTFQTDEFQNNILYCSIGFMTAICSVLHGMATVVEAWRGQTFLYYIFGMCILFNVYHVIILIIVASWKLRPEIISVLWLTSFAVAMGLTACSLQHYNMDMFVTFLFNFAVSSLCVLVRWGSKSQRQ